MFQLQLVLFGFFIGLQCNIIASHTEHEHEGTPSVSAPNDVLNLTSFGRALFGQPDFSIIDRMISAYDQLPTKNSDDFPNPEELGTYFEGDLLIPEEENDDILRNGMLAQSSRWPGGIVPYEIRGGFASNELSVISYAFSQYKARTCIQFRPRTSERDYITIENNKTGCWSSIGRLGGRQVVNLQAPYCFRKYGTTIHELAHVLGFLHEQSRYERDSYVSVQVDNVLPGMMQNFGKSTSAVSYGYGVPYDYASVMHYSPTSFSKNSKPTLVALRNTKEAKLMGQRSGFSQGDVDKINSMYGCKK